MSFKLRYLTFSVTAALMGVATSSWAQDVKTAYGFLPDGSSPGGSGIYTFDIKPDTVDNIQQVAEVSFDHASGAYLQDGIYYYIDYEQNTGGYLSHGFYGYNLEEKTVKRIADYGETQGGTIASHFAWNAQTQEMYGLNGLQSGNGLVKINLENGDVTPICTFTVDQVPEHAKAWSSSFWNDMNALAISYDGDVYAVCYTGGLYKVNVQTGQCSMIGELDYNPDNAFMYNNNCLFFDNETDELYFRFFAYYGMKYELVKIDVNTAHVTHVSKLPYEENGYQITKSSAFDGIVIPYSAAEASAPQKVQNLTIKAGEQGALTATLDWDNPTKTFGRGGTLEDLDSIVIYRGNEAVHTITNPSIGGHETWTDNLAERGYYTYRIVPYNDMGRGDRVSIGSYVGKGDPLSVTDAKVVQDGDNGVITWTAPTEGKFNSYIDQSALRYDVFRLPSREKVADHIAQTTFTDTTIPEIAKYSYNIVAYADGYQSDSTTTNVEVLGPAFNIPATFLVSKNNYDLWTNIDADGSGTSWTWQEPNHWSWGGATDAYYYEGNPAQNWLISPRIHLEQGKHYKVTFEAKTGSFKLPETLVIGFGKGTNIESMDSICNFDISIKEPATLRFNLPAVAATDDYNFALVHRMAYTYYSLAVKNVVVAEDHEGYVKGFVTSNGNPIADATVRTEDGQFVCTTDANGKYNLDYLLSGDYNLLVTALGYADQNQSVSVVELATTTADITLTPLATYTLSGKIIDVAGDPVYNAEVDVVGYNIYSTTTAADGTYSISGIYENANYGVNVSKNKLLSAYKSFVMDADKTIDLTLEDNIKPARNVKAVESENASRLDLTWDAPANDAVVDRIDDGVLTTGTGYSEGATSNSTFGVIRRNPATVHGAQFYITSRPGVSHYSVALRIFGLKENGDPDENNVLYKDTYVPITDDDWTTYYFPAPIEAPNGYYLCIASYNWIGIGIDGGGDTEKYPFQSKTNCFSGDYTTGTYYYLENQSNAALHRNFMIRAIAAPYDMPNEVKGNFMPKTIDNEQLTIDNVLDIYTPVASPVETENPELSVSNSQLSIRKTVQDRVRYNVYRFKTTDAANEAAWTSVSEGQQETNYIDANWNTLPQGAYQYAVKAIYTGDKLAETAFSDSIGNNMKTNVKFHLNTNTPDNESYGARVLMLTGAGRHVYEANADDEGNVEIDNVWKSNYDVQISLDGFNTLNTSVDVSADNEYLFSYELTENQIKPFNLIIENGEDESQKTFVWNYPEYFEEGFEDHEDFTINSPGAIGWQYIDGDGGETGAFTFVAGEKAWATAFEPMAFMIMNAYNVSNGSGGTLASSYYRLAPHQGLKSLQSWPAAGMKEDDWIITPKLHFQQPFTYRFYALNYDQNAEEVEILFSTTDANRESFIRHDSLTIMSPYGGWILNTISDIPADVKYVALRRVTDPDMSGYSPKILNIDDIAFGVNLPYTPNYVPTSTPKKMKRMPSLDGAYEVYLDGELVANTDDTEYLFDNLFDGKHTAGVLASYTSGKTEMSTIEFEINLSSGVTTILNKIEGDAEFYTINGMRVDNNNLVDGVYIVKQGGKTYKVVKRK